MKLTYTRVGFALFVSLVTTLHAGLGESGPPVVIGSTESTSPVEPATGISDAGNTVTAWRQEYADGSDPKIFVALHNALNNPVGVPRLVATDTTLGVPKLAVAPNGRFAIFYKSFGNRANLISYNFLGFETWRRDLIRKDEARDIAVDDRGNIRLVYNLLLNSFDNKQTPTGDVFTGLSGSDTRIAVQADGTFAVCYRNASGIHGRFYNADGSSRSPDFTRDFPDVDTITSYDVAATGGCSYTVAVTSGDGELHIATVGGPNEYTHQQDFAGALPGTLEIAGSPNGELLVGWVEKRGDAPSSACARRFHPRLFPAGGRILLRNNSRETSRPALAINSHGEGTVAFDRKNLVLSLPPNPPSPASRTVLAQRFAPLAEPLRDLLVAGPSSGIGQEQVTEFDSAGHGQANDPVVVYAYRDPAQGNEFSLDLRFGSGLPFRLANSSAGLRAKVVMPSRDEAFVVWSGHGKLEGRMFSRDAGTGAASPSAAPVTYASGDFLFSRYDVVTNGDGIVAVSFRPDVDTLELRRSGGGQAGLSILRKPAGGISSLATAMNREGEFSLVYRTKEVDPFASQLNLIRYSKNNFSTIGQTRVETEEDQEIANWVGPPFDVAINDAGTSAVSWVQAHDSKHSINVQMFGTSLARVGHNFAMAAKVANVGRSRLLALPDDTFLLGLGRAGTIARLTGDGSLLALPAYMVGAPEISLITIGRSRRGLFAFHRDLDDFFVVRKTFFEPLDRYGLTPVGDGTYTAPVIPGYDARIETSEDLKAWNPGDPAVPENGRYEVDASPVPGKARQFYRISLTPPEN